MMNLRNLLFSLPLVLVLMYPSISGAFVAAPAAEVELFSVGYKFDDIVFKGEASRSSLLRIDPADGRVIEVGDTGFINCTAIDFNDTGYLYAKCQRPAPPHEPVLIMLNPDTGEGTEIGETGVTESISDLAIDAEDNIFSYEEPGGLHNLHQVDSSTGAANFIGNPGIEGKGNAIFFWGFLNTLKLITWGDDQNRVFELDTETAQPTFVTNLDMIDLTGAVDEEGPCVVIAAASTRSVRLEPILETAQLDRLEAARAGIRLINGTGADAIGLNEIISNGVGMAAGVDSRFIGEPQYALSLIDIDGGISILAKIIEPGYKLDGIALRPAQTRPIPTMSEWSMIVVSVLLLAAAVYFIARRKKALKPA